MAAPLIGEQLRNFGTIPPQSRAWEFLGLLQDGCPEGFLLAPPLGAVLEQMFTGLDVVLAPPAFRVRALVVHWRYCPVRKWPVFSR